MTGPGVANRVVVVGAGVGGLAAAIALARAGREVVVLEARATHGGLAGAHEVGGRRFDNGPYVLLDRPGLAWAFDRLGLPIEDLALERLDPVYEVARLGGPTVVFHASATRTAEEIEAWSPGAGAAYLRFVNLAGAHYDRLAPMLRASDPRLAMAHQPRAWRSLPFLARSLETVMKSTQLPGPVVDALTIWTHIAALTRRNAPSTMALVPALVHREGAWRPSGGIAAIAETLHAAALQSGVDVRFGAPVARIRTSARRVVAVETTDGERLDTAVVVSNVGLATYLELVDDPPPSAERLRDWPLQSPGVCAYLEVREKEPTGQHTLRFRLPGAGAPCRLHIRPAPDHDGATAARLLVPMRHDDAEQLGRDGQRAFLERVLEEPWWREDLTHVEVLATRTPTEWGHDFGLYRDAMNPAMTAKLMRSGRLARRSKTIKGLYLAGSATHPGQWVSFCTTSGVLAADAVLAA